MVVMLAAATLCMIMVSAVEAIVFDKLQTVVRLAYLFSASDLTTTVLPTVVFGLLAALSGSALTTNSDPVSWLIIARAPYILLYVWMNVFIFCLSNQRLDAAMVEDRVNKPWRPLPSGLVTQGAVRRAILALLPFTALLSYGLGATLETALQYGATWAYNDLAGADENFLVRNAIVATGLIISHEGALRVACGPYGEPNQEAMKWSFILGCIFFSTIHTSDFRDIQGDRARLRQTAPIVLGESLARWSVAVAVCFWTVFCSVMWRMQLMFYFHTIILALTVAFRQVFYRGQKEDQKTFLAWVGWIISLYFLPIIYSSKQNQLEL